MLTCCGSNEKDKRKGRQTDRQKEKEGGRGERERDLSCSTGGNTETLPKCRQHTVIRYKQWNKGPVGQERWLLFLHCETHRQGSCRSFDRLILQHCGLAV